MAEETQFSLAEIAGIDMDAVDEVRFTLFPKGNFMWEPVPDKQNVSQADGKPVQIVLTHKCVAVHAVTDKIAETPGYDPQSNLGRELRQSYQITSVEALGRLKAFITDTGFRCEGLKLQEMLNAYGSSGVKFDCPVSHRPDKNDSEKFYDGFNTSKLKPVQ